MKYGERADCPVEEKHEQKGLVLGPLRGTWYDRKHMGFGIRMMFCLCHL